MALASFWKCSRDECQEKETELKHARVRRKTLCGVVGLFVFRRNPLPPRRVGWSSAFLGGANFGIRIAFGGAAPGIINVSVGQKFRATEEANGYFAPLCKFGADYFHTEPDARLIKVQVSPHRSGFVMGRGRGRPPYRG
ncbi:hypothetical protein TRVL_06820 [Trypanosoma vivax]|nr:hypothetical protein TRVL_06820 [Trypanosoma vivax]